MCDKGERADESGFDDVLERLKSVVSKLEQGNLSLEDSLRAYEEGVALARRGHDLLDRAEKRVEVLVQAREGEPETEPLDGEGAGGHDPGA